MLHFPTHVLGLLSDLLSNQQGSVVIMDPDSSPVITAQEKLIFIKLLNKLIKKIVKNSIKVDSATIEVIDEDKQRCDSHWGDKLSWLKMQSDYCRELAEQIVQEESTIIVSCQYQQALLSLSNRGDKQALNYFPNVIRKVASGATKEAIKAFHLQLDVKGLYFSEKIGLTLRNACTDLEKRVYIFIEAIKSQRFNPEAVVPMLFAGNFMSYRFSNPIFIAERGISLDKVRLTDYPAEAALKMLLRPVALLHAEGIVHFDLKPHNFIQFGDTIKVCDLGNARQLGKETLLLDLTPSYASPEVFQRNITNEADQFLKDFYETKIRSSLSGWMINHRASLIKAISERFFSTPITQDKVFKIDAYSVFLTFIAAYHHINPCYIEKQFDNAEALSEKLQSVTQWLPLNKLSQLDPKDRWTVSECTQYLKQQTKKQVKSCDSTAKRQTDRSNDLPKNYSQNPMQFFNVATNHSSYVPLDDACLTPDERVMQEQMMAQYNIKP